MLIIQTFHSRYQQRLYQQETHGELLSIAFDVLLILDVNCGIHMHCPVEIIAFLVKQQGYLSENLS